MTSLSCVVFVGWGDGAERHTQIQEEIRHFSALQAYLNLRGHSSAFSKAACLHPAVSIWFVLYHIDHILPKVALKQVHGRANGQWMWIVARLVTLVHRALNPNVELGGFRWWVNQCGFLSAPDGL